MQEGQNRKTSSLSILAIAGVEPYQEKPGEEYMNEAQLAHFRRILEAWRNQLRDASIAPLHICRMKQPTSRTR